MSTREQRRKAFEAEFGKPPYEFNLARQKKTGTFPGSYRDYHVQCAWEAWNTALDRHEGKRLPELSTMKRFSPPGANDFGMRLSDQGCWLHIGDLYEVDDIIADDRRRRGDLP